MKQTLKKLYEFTLHREAEVEIEEEKEIDGERVVVKKKVKTELPVQLFIKKPSRSELEEIEFEYDKEWARLMRAGLLSRAMLEKQILEQGGVLTDGERKTRLEVAKDLSAKITEYEELLVQENKDEERVKTLGQEIIDGQISLQSFHSVEESVYNNCAETKARNKTVNYILANFCYIDEGTPKLFFQGDTFEEKLDDWAEKQEVDDKFINEAVEFFSFFVGLWYYNKASTPEEFKKYEEDYKKRINE